MTYLSSGVASLGEVGVLAIVLPLVGFIATKLYTLQNDLLYLKGTRIKILNEIVSGIKVRYCFYLYSIYLSIDLSFHIIEMFLHG